MPMPPEASISGAGRPRSRSAEHEHASGDRTAAIRSYLRLYADVARMAQTDRVLPSSAGINVVDGSKTSCTNARPGLNLSPLDQSGWGANATTTLIDETGKFGVAAAAPGTAQHLVAIVLSRSAFKADKEETLGILRHEMVHAEDYAEEAARNLRARPPAKPKTVKAAEAARAEATKEARTATASSELRGYVEGFMTMFHLTHPAPTSATQPAFVELQGALDTGHGELFPWAEASDAARADVMGRIQEYSTVTRSTPSIAPRSTRGSLPSSRSCVPCSRRVASVTRSSRRSGTGTLLPRAEGRRRSIVLSRAPPDLPTIVAGGSHRP